MNLIQIGVRSPSSLNDHLLDYMAQTGMSKTEVVISALASYMGCASEIPLKERMAHLEAKVAALETMVRKI